MNIDRAVLTLAGSLTLLGVLLAAFPSPWWLLPVAFVGADQLQAGLTRFCPAARVFARLGLPAGCAFGERTDGGADGTEGPGTQERPGVD